MAEESQSPPTANGLSQDTVENARPPLLSSTGKEVSQSSLEGSVDEFDSNKAKRARRGTIRVACNACRTKKVRKLATQVRFLYLAGPSFAPTYMFLSSFAIADCSRQAAMG